jgi:hypothetical protein
MDGIVKRKRLRRDLIQRQECFKGWIFKTRMVGIMI